MVLYINKSVVYFKNKYLATLFVPYALPFRFDALMVQTLHGNPVCFLIPTLILFDNLILDSAMASINENSHYSDEERLNLENLCLDIVEEYMQSRTITVKGKRKGKTKSHLIVKEKKKPGRKKKIKRTQRFKSEDDYNFE